MVEVVVSDDIFFITKGGPCRQGMVEFVAASDDFFILKHLLNRSSRPAGKRSDSPVCFLRRKVPGCGRLPPNFAHDIIIMGYTKRYQIIFSLGKKISGKFTNSRGLVPFVCSFLWVDSDVERLV